MHIQHIVAHQMHRFRTRVAFSTVVTLVVLEPVPPTRVVLIRCGLRSKEQDATSADWLETFISRAKADKADK